MEIVEFYEIIQGLNGLKLNCPAGNKRKPKVFLSSESIQYKKQLIFYYVLAIGNFVCLIDWKMFYVQLSQILK